VVVVCVAAVIIALDMTCIGTTDAASGAVDVLAGASCKDEAEATCIQNVLVKSTSSARRKKSISCPL
jgi:hypothetical protein